MTAHVRVLGTAQDGGIPQTGCTCETCRGAHRLVASIAVIGESGRTLLVDATPDITRQIACLDRLDGVLLTHAHVGHVLGLGMLGREAMNVRDLPVWGTDRMGAYLRENKPFAHLVARGQIRLERLAPDEAFDFDGVRITPFLVPHRSEDTDTVGVIAEGASARLLYLPDADYVPPEIEQRIRDTDVALIDGTFYDEAELVGRAMSEVPHPLVRDTVEQLAGARGEIWFTHLNHTNPLVGRPALPAPCRVLEDGQVFRLSEA